MSLLGASLGAEKLAIIESVFDGVVVQRHPYGDRKIERAAVIFVDGPDRDGDAVDPGQAGADHERGWSDGRGMIFLPRKRQAAGFFKALKDPNPGLKFGSNEGATVNVTDGSYEDHPLEALLTYKRSTFGHGVNIKETCNGRSTMPTPTARFPASPPLPFRHPDAPESYAAMRARDLLELMMQNAGRLFRGEEGKVVFEIVMNADEPLREEYRKSEAIHDGSRLPPVFVSAPSLAAAIEMGRGWLESGGVTMPEPNPDIMDAEEGRQEEEDQG